MTVGLLSFTSSVTVVQPVIKPFNIVLQWNANALAQPQGWRNQIQTAANVLMTLIKDTAKVYIPVTVLASSATSSAGPQSSAFLSYSTLKTALTALPNPTATYTSWLNALPGGTTYPSGSTSAFVTGAVCKARGIGSIADNSASPDGTINIGDSVLSSSLVGVALHEITHALGRSNDEPTFLLGKFKNSDGTRFTSGTNAAGYFSADNGVTNLINYDDTASDPSDFKGDTLDVFNAFYDPANPYTQVLSAIDIKVIETLGFSVQ